MLWGKKRRKTERLTNPLLLCALSHPIQVRDQQQQVLEQRGQVQHVHLGQEGQHGHPCRVQEQEPAHGHPQGREERPDRIMSRHPS